MTEAGHEVQRREEALALKAAIVDRALAALISMDADGRIVEFNPAAETLFGRWREERLGQVFGDVELPERVRPVYQAALRRLAEGEAPTPTGHRMELHALRGDGTEFPVDFVLWRTDAGGAPYFTASLVDASDRHHAAQQVGRQREALRQSEKLTAMGSLLAGVAHELNNPLAIVMGRASLLEEKCEDPELRADVLRIREAAERCGRIVRTFLNMARNRPAQRTPVDVNELVRVSTGVEHRREGREPRVWLRIADNGPGVPPEFRSRIFEPFFTTKGEGMGTGLGLAVSRSVVIEHGGDLILEQSGAERGAVFRASLPISGMALDDSGPVPLDEPEAPAPSRVLVVDDEPELASLMRDMLEQAGYEVATAESGGLALALLDEARFDAIVSDLRMPDMDGPGLWRAVVERHPLLAQRMLFVTGDTLSPDAREFLRTARCSALDKPFSKAGLLAGVKALLA